MLFEMHNFFMLDMRMRNMLSSKSLYETSGSKLYARSYVVLILQADMWLLKPKYFLLPITFISLVSHQRKCLLPGKS